MLKNEAISLLGLVPAIALSPCMSRRHSHGHFSHLSFDRLCMAWGKNQKKGAIISTVSAGRVSASIVCHTSVDPKHGLEIEEGAIPRCALEE